MTAIRSSAKIYVWTVISVGTFLGIFLLLTGDWQQVDFLGLVLFSMVAWLAESYPVKLPKGGGVSVGFAINLAAIILFPVQAAMIIGAVGMMLCRKPKDTPQHWVKTWFNGAQLTLAMAVAGMVYRGIVGYQDIWQPIGFVGIGVSIIIYLLLNIAFVTLVVALNYGVPVKSVWVTNFRWAIPSALALAPIGLLIAMVYRSSGWVGVVLFFVPLMIARQSFQSYMDMRQNCLDTVLSLAAAIDAKHPYTRGHSERVAAYAVAVARELKWPEDRVELLQYMALLHDTGKLGVSEGVLNKPDRLTEKEYGAIKGHPHKGYEIVCRVKFLAHMADVVLHHHERWDGLGYPSGLAGEAIPEGARIIAVADTFDAMTSDRPYRSALPSETAFTELQAVAGTQLDPRVVQAFLRVYPKLQPRPETAGVALTGRVSHHLKGEAG